ncbi:MAG: glycosyltransferase [Planctomycetaceae bacterium]|nr:MAG: glycosyltransferase [Planctomycetaceae bacterium]
MQGDSGQNDTRGPRTNGRRTAQSANRPVQVLVLMAKHWRPGLVKTRLAATIGNERAAALHRCFTTHLCHRLAGCGDRRIVAFAPDDCYDAFRQPIDPAWELIPQGSGDLGERMWRVCRAILAADSPTRPPPPDPLRVDLVLIGADLPTLDPTTIGQAFSSLERHDLVLGPAEDGGYYLLGMTPSRLRQKTESPSNLACEQLFEGIPWGTPKVFQATLRVAEQLGLHTARLSRREDIDEWSDLRRLAVALEAATATADIELREDLLDVLGCRRIAEFRSEGLGH